MKRDGANSFTAKAGVRNLVNYSRERTELSRWMVMSRKTVKNSKQKSLDGDEPENR